MPNIWLKETYVDADRNVRFGESEIMDTGLDAKDLGRLFRRLRAEYGRCVSKVYTDTATEDGIPTGWVFKKRMHYDDTQTPYIREVWCHLYAEPPKTIYTRFRLDKKGPL